MGIGHYLAGKHYSEIKVGQSGADVYEIDGELILKHVERQRLKSALFDTYTREALFYQAMADDRRGYLPRIVELKISDDEIVLLMKKYGTPARSDIDEPTIRKVAGALARVHTDSVPAFLSGNSEHSGILSGQQIEECSASWACVLQEHPGFFDEAPLKHIAEKINRIITWHDSEEKTLVHGDFHWDNLLEDANGDILISDWQSVRLGGASGDLSFFMSRLGSDGVSLDPMLFLRCYADAIREIGGGSVDVQSIEGHIAAANVITSFVFWHQFLRGADAESVRGIYQKMAEDFQLMKSDSICS